MAKKKDRDIEKGYTTKQIVAKMKRLNFNSSGPDDLMLDAQSSENLNYGL